MILSILVSILLQFEGLPQVENEDHYYYGQNGQVIQITTKKTTALRREVRASLGTMEGEKFIPGSSEQFLVLVSMDDRGLYIHSRGSTSSTQIPVFSYLFRYDTQTDFYGFAIIGSEPLIFKDTEEIDSNNSIDRYENDKYSVSLDIFSYEDRAIMGGTIRSKDEEFTFTLRRPEEKTPEVTTEEPRAEPIVEVSSDSTVPTP